MRNAPLNLRHFKRNASYIVILWDRVKDVPEESISVSCSETGKDYKKVQFALGMPEDIDLKGAQQPRDEDTVICVILHEQNDLDPDTSYYFKVKYGDLVQVKRIFEVGVYPDHEREDKKANIHLFGWDRRSSRWRKVDCTQLPDGKVALLVVTPEQLEKLTDKERK